MGRTKRKRSLKPRQLKKEQTNLSHEESTISLRRWLKQNNFSDHLNLQLRHFTQTGRGITSKQSVKENDVLLRVPLDLLITFDTVKKSGLLKCFKTNARFATQTLIAFYLAMEKHKGQQSLWKNYIDTLPNPEPVLPWLCNTPEELEVFPNDLKLAAIKLYETFSESFTNLKKSICLTTLCDCCDTPLSRVLERNIFKWAYILVNTRAVYIDPENITSKNSPDISILSDEPSMALCPFLDMFNHSHLAQTKVNVVFIQGRSFYELRTATGFKKYEQFFISYGAHDNEKLLMEYGFFIPENIFDCVKFCFREVVEVLRFRFDVGVYKFIKNHGFDVADLYISFNGVSFYLKAILFIAHFPEFPNFNSVIFSNSYPSDFGEILRSCSKKLLDYKYEVYCSDVNRIGLELSEHLRLLRHFLDYRIGYVEKIATNRFKI